MSTDVPCHTRREREVMPKKYADHLDPTRLWSRYAVTESGCWEFTGMRDGKGYGRMVHAGKLMRTHRISRMITHGEIPPGLVVMHACDNPPCINPEHLSVGTPADNSADMVAKGRSPRHPLGIEHFAAKLTDDDVRAIRAARDRGEQCKSIAQRWGISGSHVSRLTRGLRRETVADRVDGAA